MGEGKDQMRQKLGEKLTSIVDREKRTNTDKRSPRRENYSKGTKQIPKTIIREKFFLKLK